MSAANVAGNPIPSVDSSRHSSPQESTGCLGTRKVTKSICLGLGSIGTAGLTALAVAIIGLSATGIGALVAGALISIALAVAAVKTAMSARKEPLVQEPLVDTPITPEILERKLQGGAAKPLLTRAELDTPSVRENAPELMKAFNFMSPLENFFKNSQETKDRFLTIAINHPTHFQVCIQHLYQMNLFLNMKMTTLTQETLEVFGNAFIDRPERAESLFNAWLRDSRSPDFSLVETCRKRIENILNPKKIEAQAASSAASPSAELDLVIASPSISLYRNNLKGRDFGQEAAQLTPLKTDSSGCFGIPSSPESPQSLAPHLD